MTLQKYVLKEDLQSRDFTTESYYFHGTTLDKAISILKDDTLNVSKFNTGWLRSARSYGQDPFDNSKSNKNFVSLTRSISSKVLQGAECFIVLDKDKLIKTFKKYKVNPQDDLESGKPWYIEKGNWFEEVIKGNITNISKFIKGIILNSYYIVFSIAPDLEIKEIWGDKYAPNDIPSKEYLKKIDRIDMMLSGTTLYYTTNKTPIPILKSINEYESQLQFFNDIMPIIKKYFKDVYDENIEEIIV